MPYTKKELQAMLNAKRKEIADAIKSGRNSVTILHEEYIELPTGKRLCIDQKINLQNACKTPDNVTEDAEFEVIKSEIKNKQS